MDGEDRARVEFPASPDGRRSGDQPRYPVFGAGATFPGHGHGESRGGTGSRCWTSRVTAYRLDQAREVTSVDWSGVKDLQLGRRANDRMWAGRTTVKCRWSMVAISLTPRGFSRSDDTRICTPKREVGILRNQLAHARQVIG